MTSASRPAVLATFYDGWANHQRLLIEALRPLSDEQMKLRPAPGQWAVWQLASNMAGGRAYWFHDLLKEGDVAIRESFRVENSTVPGLPPEDAGWEDDETHPRSAAELIDAFEKTWRMIDDCLRRWTVDDLQVEFSRQLRSGTQTFTRGWVIWHLMEHEGHHGGEISITLRMHGLPTLDI